MGGGAQTPALTALLCLGLCRAPWDKAQAGTLPKPSIWADSGPLVAVGSPVTLWCQGSPQAEVYRMYKEGGLQPWVVQAQQDSRHKASFSIIQSMSSYDSGQYWCVYLTSLGPSQPSDPLTLVVTGATALILWSTMCGPCPATPCSSMLQSLTLRCRCEPSCDRYALTRPEGDTSPQHLAGQPSPDFLLGPVSGSHGGRYRCYGGRQGPYAWSAPSNPLDVLVAGMYRNPSLQAQPGPSVPRGAMVALRCGSEEAMDTFLLHKVGSGAPPQRLRVLGSATAAQATFMLGPVTSAHGGTYRCYGAHSTEPYLLSQPSDPLQLEVSGGPEPSSPSRPQPGSPTGHSRELDWKWSSQDSNWCPYGMPALQAVASPATPQHQPQTMFSGPSAGRWV
nr:leukocyte immunoglobulin-like receptor subfamily A member 6 isoform X10 [Oryctolagus cuniculus]